MTKRRTAVLATSLLLGACGGGATGDAGAGRAAAPRYEDIANAAIGGLFDEPVLLAEGRWEGEPFVAGGASRPSAGLAPGFVRHGDLDGDGDDEAVVLAWSSSGGSGTFNYVAAFDSGPVNVATAPLGDRVQVVDARIEDGRLLVDVVQHDDDDSACCPTQTARRSWRLAEHRLVEEDASVTGSLSIATLGGVDWRLAAMAMGGAAVEHSVTLSFDGNRVTGQGPCNRYFTQVVPGKGPADFSVEKIGATSMYCGEDAQALEDAYFDALASSRHFAFVGGRLLLTYGADDEPKTMLFER
ncbi:MAG: META domain-containing protein [Gammaproteobacteria bacterium]|nr:META domain-containing protein [Gammaproteobacteria bacterium]MDH4254511.1 META domain-containing protein [Gammaproteobacteria bacterium]MDH5309591.1 META domain-containing protein [Gammaproteobacteria bacterium]